MRAGIALNGLVVFCIDNDARILDGMRLLLERWGCRVSTFAGVEPRFEAQRTTLPAPDIVLADYHLDGENGLDAIRQTAGPSFGSDTAAILVTADRSTEVRAAAESMDVPVHQQAGEAGRAALADHPHAADDAGGGGVILASPRPFDKLRTGAGRSQPEACSGSALILRQHDHRLRAAVDAELLQDRRDMRLDRRLRDVELIGDLLVEQALGEHAEHPRLLRRQAEQLADQVGHFRIALDAELDIAGRGDAAGQHRLHGAADLLDARRFGDEAGGAEFERAPDRDRIVMRRNDDHRHGRMDAAQRDQPGQPAGAGHRQVEQDEVEVVIAGDHRLGVVEIAGLENLDVVGHCRQSLLERATKQRMIVSDDELVADRQSVPPVDFRTPLAASSASPTMR